MADTAVPAIGEIIATQGGTMSATTIVDAINELKEVIAGGGISDGAVTTAKLADGAVTADKLSQEVLDAMGGKVRYSIIPAQAFTVTVEHDGGEDTYTTTDISVSEESVPFADAYGYPSLFAYGIPVKAKVDGVSRLAFTGTEQDGSGNDALLISIYESASDHDADYPEYDNPWLSVTMDVFSSVQSVRVNTSIAAGAHSIEIWYEPSQAMSSFGVTFVEQNGVVDVRASEYALTDVHEESNPCCVHVKMSGTYVTGSTITGPDITSRRNTDPWSRFEDFTLLEQNKETLRSNNPASIAGYVTWDDSQHCATDFTFLGLVEIKALKGKESTISLTCDSTSVTLVRAESLDHDDQSDSDYKFYAYVMYVFHSGTLYPSNWGGGIYTLTLSGNN